jgi:hypothetical protein
LRSEETLDENLKDVAAILLLNNTVNPCFKIAEGLDIVKDPLLKPVGGSVVKRVHLGRLVAVRRDVVFANATFPQPRSSEERQ